MDIKLTLLASSPFGGVAKSYATATRERRRAQSRERKGELSFFSSRRGFAAHSRVLSWLAPLAINKELVRRLYQTLPQVRNAFLREYMSYMFIPTPTYLRDVPV